MEKNHDQTLQLSQMNTLLLLYPSQLDIEEFALRNQDWGKTYHYVPLKKWGESLYTQANQFEIEALAKNLKRFPKFIENIRSFLS